MATVKVMFKDEKYNYITSFNGSFIDAENYFVGQWFNLGCEDDNMQQCVAIIYS